MRISDWSSDVCSSDLVAEAQASLFRALKDGRRTNFTAELNQLRDAMARYGVDIRTVDADLRRQGQAYDQLIAKARTYTNETRFQREIGRASCRERWWQ